MKKNICIIFCSILILSGCNLQKDSVKEVERTSARSTTARVETTLPGDDLASDTFSPLILTDIELIKSFEDNVKKTVKYGTISGFLEGCKEVSYKIYKIAEQDKEYLFCVVTVENENEVRSYSQQIIASDGMHILPEDRDLEWQKLIIGEPKYFESFAISYPQVEEDVICTGKINVLDEYFVPQKSNHINKELNILKNSIVDFINTSNENTKMRIDNSLDGQDVQGLENYKEIITFDNGKYSFIFLPHNEYENFYEFYMKTPRGDLFKCSHKYDMFSVKENIYYNPVEMEKYKIACSDNYFSFEVVKQE